MAGFYIPCFPPKPIILHVQGMQVEVLCSLSIGYLFGLESTLKMIVELKKKTYCTCTL